MLPRLHLPRCIDDMEKFIANDNASPHPNMRNLMNEPPAPPTPRKSVVKSLDPTHPVKVAGVGGAGLFNNRLVWGGCTGWGGGLGVVGRWFGRLGESVWDGPW